jgi:uncharacterized protein (DUF2147 family)
VARRVTDRIDAATVKKLRLFAATVALLAFAGAALIAPVPASAQTFNQNKSAGQPADPTGVWLVAKQIARVRIVNCDGKLWGVIVWEARPGIDNKNPDPNLRGRPTLGMPVLLNMTQTKANQWDGHVYNSEDGHTYSASIILLNDNYLQVKGCFLAVFCGGETWTRVAPQEATQQAPPQSAHPAQPQRRSSRAPSQRTRPVPNNRKPADTEQPKTDKDVCLRILGFAGLPHERRLK